VSMRKRRIVGLSADLESFKKDLPQTVEEFKRVRSPKELVALKTAAQISSARSVRTIGTNKSVVPKDGELKALGALVSLLPQMAGDTLEEGFHALATLIFKVAEEVCVSHAINRSVHMAIAKMVGGAPPTKPQKVPITVYDNDDVDLLLKPLRKAIKNILQIRRGPNPNTLWRIRETRKALGQLRKDGIVVKPTQAEVARKLNLGEGPAGARAIRKWHSQCDLKWDEWLKLCGWYKQPERD
jgi:hypothetical protein